MRSGPRALSRAWCNFELSETLKRGHTLLVELSPADHARLPQLLRAVRARAAHARLEQLLLVRLDGALSCCCSMAGAAGGRFAKGMYLAMVFFSGVLALVLRRILILLVLVES